MLDKAYIITEINRTCRLFFTESTFVFQPKGTNRFVVFGDNNSKAINNYNNSLEEISVVKWFNDVWFYSVIRFEDSNTFISISIFQGEEGDDTKHQLFRAEWDDYNNQNERHPQPHWHITSNQAIENTFKEIANFNGTEVLVDLFEEEKSKIIDINKIHFAMNGNWINNESHIHSLNDNNKLIKWFQGLLAYLKTQLDV